MTDVAFIRSWLEHNISSLPEEYQHITKTKNDLLKSEPIELHDEILREYEEMVKRMISVELGKTLGVPPDAVMIVLEEINIGDFL